MHSVPVSGQFGIGRPTVSMSTTRMCESKTLCHLLNPVLKLAIAECHNACPSLLQIVGCFVLGHCWGINAPDMGLIQDHAHSDLDEVCPVVPQRP